MIACRLRSDRPVSAAALCWFAEALG